MASKDREYLNELVEARRKRIKKVKDAPNLGFIETAKSLWKSITSISEKNRKKWGDSAEKWKELGESKKEEPKVEKKEVEVKKKEPEPVEKKPEVKKKKPDPWVKAGKKWLNLRKKRKNESGLGSK